MGTLRDLPALGLPTLPPQSLRATVSRLRRKSMAPLQRDHPSHPQAPIDAEQHGEERERVRFDFAQA